MEAARVGGATAAGGAWFLKQALVLPLAVGVETVGAGLEPSAIIRLNGLVFALSAAGGLATGAAGVGGGGGVTALAGGETTGGAGAAGAAGVGTGGGTGVRALSA